MSKILTVELTDDEAKALEGLASKLTMYEKFIPAGMLPIIKKVEAALDDADNPKIFYPYNNAVSFLTNTDLLHELLNREAKSDRT